MRLAVISDIHSNMIAFKQVLDDIAKEDIDKIIFLGDYITDGVDANEILELVREKGDYVIRGNRENYMLNFDTSKIGFANYDPIAYTYKSLNKENLQYISSLKEKMLIEIENIKILLIHGNGYISAYDNQEKSDASKDCLIEENDFDLCLFGHTHRFEDYIYKGKRFINPGSLNEPADGPQYKYVILDIDDKQIDVTVKKFDTVKTIKELKENLYQTDYYKENKIWCDINLLMTETGIDYCKPFLDIVEKNKQGHANLSKEEFNKIWELSYEEFKNIRGTYE